MPKLGRQTLPRIVSEQATQEPAGTTSYDSKVKSSRTLVLNTAWQQRFEDIGKGGELLLQHAHALCVSPPGAHAREMEAAELHASNPELFERRKVLSQSAFVRHSTADLVTNLRRAAGSNPAQPIRAQPRNPGSLPSPAKGGRGINGMSLPGNVFRGSAAGYGDRPLSYPGTSLFGDDPGQLMSLEALVLRQQNMSLVDKFGLPHTPMALRRNVESFAPQVAGTLNGIGHPLLNDSVLMPKGGGAESTAFVYNSKGTLTAALATSVAAAVGGARQLSSGMQQDGKASGGGVGYGGKLAPLAGFGADHSLMDLGAHRSIQDISFIIRKELKGTGVVSGAVANTKPLSDDTLNLWRGKRLNRAEMKVEQRLHVLRNNPTAKIDLVGRVKGFVEEKAQEHAERDAIMLFAAERREQKTHEFVQQRLKSNNKGKSISPQRLSQLIPPNSLFDPQTGKPREDSQPLPEDAFTFWSGWAVLAGKLAGLRSQLLQRRANYQLMLMSEEAAALIQRWWKVFKARRKFLAMRRSAVIIQRAVRKFIAQKKAKRQQMKAQTGMKLADAAEMILNFLLYVTSESKNSLAGATVKSTVARVHQTQRSAQLLRLTRLSLMLKQWSDIEARCIELAKRRMQGAMAANPTAADLLRQQQQAASKAAARKKASVPRYDEDPDERIRHIVIEAVNACSTADRIILEEHTAVPLPVKTAVIQAYLNHKWTAYITLLGLYWKTKAAFKILKRNSDIQSHLMGVSIADAVEAGPPRRFTIARKLGAAVPKTDISTSTTSPEASHAHGTDFLFPLPPSTVDQDPGAVPLYRMFATIQEIKCIMQQGVAETPSYGAFMQKGQLDSYEQQISDQMASRIGQGDEPPSPKPEGSSDLPQTQKPENGQSWTLGRLTQRWHAECTPRTEACLPRRYTLHKCDLVEQVCRGVWMQPIDMSGKLMELRDG